MVDNAFHRNGWLGAALLVLGLSATSVVTAQTLDFAPCLRIADMSSRLACYDRAAGYSQSGVVPAAPAASVIPVLPPPAGTPPAPAAQRPLVAPVVPVAPRDPVAAFGAEAKQQPDQLTAKVAKEKEEAKAVQQIEARVTAVRARPEGQQVLTLDNGQVWTQTEVRRDPQFVVGDVVVIKRGMLGSFLLTRQKGSASTRVQRIS